MVEVVERPGDHARDADRCVERARVAVLDVAFPRDDVAVATTGLWPVDKRATVDLDRPVTVVVYVLVREPDGWWVASCQFTRVAER